MPVISADHRRPARRRGGFTLIELMIVVFIVGLLIALTVTFIPKVLRAAHGAQTSAQMTAIATSIQAYYNEFRAYPGPLPNSEVGATYYPASNYTTSNPQGAFITDPNSNSPVTLQLGTGALGSETFVTFTQYQQITGAENLVLGLLGGLELKIDSTTTPYTIKTFAYSDASIYPDGVTAAPLGPMSLNPNAPKRLGTYIQVRSGDLSNSRSMAAPTVYQDSGGRIASDSPIPEFLDKFSNAMPILYIRTNVGGKAIAAVGSQTGLNSGSVVSQTNSDGTTSPVIAEYDLAQVLGYTQSPTMGQAIGTVPGDPARNHHGLQDLGLMTDTVMGDPTPPTGFYNAGKNGLAYLKDPNNPGTSNAPDYSKSPPTIGNARQKDAFILISAGPDGLYGTADDIIYPGGTVSGQ